ncbi:MAG: aminoacyl-tRNA hydrolase [Cyanobacteria bacterium SZAS TMP-1]|nr:aminoacyl-tRNA hydrolase [Cyanobacteria bacterium SZAS TMP-1]
MHNKSFLAGAASLTIGRMKVIVGLGNPGLEYENTRHNAGFRLIDMLATAYGAELKSSKGLHSVVAKISATGQSGGSSRVAEDILLVKPMTYMNLSGQAVQAVLRWYKVQAAPGVLLVAHDDVAIDLGRLRVQTCRGAGGQHGVESIIEHLSGSNRFDRLKIGVGPDPGGAVRGNYLLSKFREEERAIFERVLEDSLLAVKVWLKSGALEAANRFNSVDHSVSVGGT